MQSSMQFDFNYFHRLNIGVVKFHGESYASLRSEEYEQRSAWWRRETLYPL